LFATEISASNQPDIALAESLARSKAGFAAGVACCGLSCNIDLRQKAERQQGNNKQST
jgi:hypothetical protein